jgi:hypothetical protein
MEEDGGRIVSFVKRKKRGRRKRAAEDEAEGKQNARYQGIDLASKDQTDCDDREKTKDV